MATAAVLLPSHARVEPGSSQLAPATYPSANSSPSIDVDGVTASWIASINTILGNRDYAALKQLFLPESYWRDQLGLSWDFHTLHGPEKIISFLSSHPAGCRIESLKIDTSAAPRMPTVTAVDFDGTINGVQSCLVIETDVGRGRGLVRLAQDQGDGGKWKAFTLFTAIYELKGYEENVKTRRPLGVDHGEHPDRKNWQERRAAQENFEGDKEPTVLILGQ